MGIILDPVLSLHCPMTSSTQLPQGDARWLLRSLGQLSPEPASRVHPSARTSGNCRRFPSGCQPAPWRNHDVRMGAGERLRALISIPLKRWQLSPLKNCYQLTGRHPSCASPEPLWPFALGLKLCLSSPSAFERSGALHRAQIPGAIRMTEITPRRSFRWKWPQPGRSLLGVGDLHPQTQLPRDEALSAMMGPGGRYLRASLGAVRTDGVDPVKRPSLVSTRT